MAGIGVISNPLSGRNRRNPQRQERLAYPLGARGELALPEGLDRLEAELLVFRERQIEVLCINGGDGTIHQVMTALLRVYGAAGPFPQIALLKGGTMNTIARNVGVRMGAEDMLGHVVSRYHSGAAFPTTTRNLLVADDTRAGFIFGNVGIARFLEAYYAGGDASPWKAVRLLASLVVAAVLGTPYAEEMLGAQVVRITADGQPVARERFTMLGAATVADIGIGFRPFYGILQNPDHIHLIGIGCPPFQFATALPRIRLALPTRRADVTDLLARQLHLELPAPVGYTIDGDLYPPVQSVRLAVGPRVTFITG